MTLPIIAELRFPWQVDSPQIGGDGNFCIFDEVVETDRESGLQVEANEIITRLLT